MPIKYRCPQCDLLLSIATRKAGHEVPCPRCRAATVVPKADFDQPAEPAEPPASEPPPLPATPPAPPRHPVLHVTDENPAPRRPPVVPRQDEPPPDALEILDDPEDGEASAPQSEAVDEDLGGFQLRKSNPQLGELDLTSMVDVTFLLLIFFMVTASFSLQKTIEVPAPKQDQKGAAQSLTIEDLQLNTIFVKIDERNGIFVDDAPTGDPGKLTEVLTQARLTTLRTELAIDAHPEALHETVVMVIDAATEAGMQKIRIVSRSGGTE